MNYSDLLKQFESLRREHDELYRQHMELSRKFEKYESRRETASKAILIFTSLTLIVQIMNFVGIII